MKKKWKVKVEDKDYTVEVSHLDLTGKRKILVNGEAIDSMFGLPKKKDFMIGRKKATLQRRSTVNRNLELYIEGEKIGLSA